MKELQGDLWDWHSHGHYIVITTNHTVKMNGAAVMGRGIAFQAKERFPDLPRRYGHYLLANQNKYVTAFEDLRLFLFPVKYHWKERASLDLILHSCLQITQLVNCSRLSLGEEVRKVYMPRPGCGNGGLQWSVVKPFIAPVLDDRFTVVEREST